MNTKIFKYFIFSTTLVVLMGCGSAESDLDAICEEATALKTQMEAGQGEYADASPENRARLVAKNIDARLKTPSIKKAWEVLATAAPAERYELLQGAAAEEGIANWQCEPVKEWWAPEPVQDPIPE